MQAKKIEFFIPKLTGDSNNSNKNGLYLSMDTAELKSVEVGINMGIKMLENSDLNKYVPGIKLLPFEPHQDYMDAKQLLAHIKQEYCKKNNILYTQQDLVDDRYEMVEKVMNIFPSHFNDTNEYNLQKAIIDNDGRVGVLSLGQWLYEPGSRDEKIIYSDTAPRRKINRVVLEHAGGFLDKYNKKLYKELANHLLLSMSKSNGAHLLSVIQPTRFKPHSKYVEAKSILDKLRQQYRRKYSNA